MPALKLNYYTTYSGAGPLISLLPKGDCVFRFQLAGSPI